MPDRRTFLKFCIGGLIGSFSIATSLKYYRQNNLLKIVEYPNPILRAVSRPIRRIDDKIVKLSEYMISTLRYEALLEFFSRASLYKGLAAPQVGHSIRMIVCGLYGQITVLINPEIIEQKGNYASKEFCLSLPDQETRTIPRPNLVKVKYTNLDSKETILTAHGSSAALLAHEIDHLNGILYIDY
jgi:peptide deformylase